MSERLVTGRWIDTGYRLLAVLINLYAAER